MAEQLEKKVVTLDSLKVVVDKIKHDYPTRQEVTQQIANSDSSGSVYATDEEVLALFDEAEAEDPVQ